MKPLKPYVLIVDDDEFLLGLLRLALDTEGFETGVARTGLAALAQAAERTPAAILLDINMPEMDGWSVLRRLRDDPRTEDVPVAVMSAGFRAADLRARRDGARALPRPDAFLEKPFRMSWLMQVVRQLVERAPVAALA